MEKCDKEFYGNYIVIEEKLKKEGWKRHSIKRTKTTIMESFKKDGYMVNIIYGCEEDVKNEVF